MGAAPLESPVREVKSSAVGRVSVPTLVGVILAALGVALTGGGLVLNEHSQAVGGASLAAGALIFFGYMLLVAAVLSLSVSSVRLVLRGARRAQHP
jgi:hypothetical protein